MMAGQQTVQTRENADAQTEAGRNGHARRERGAWPDAVAFQEALQNPGLALPHDASLGSGRVATNRLGLPLAYTGRFAAVFKITDASGASWAVRCFTSEGEGARRATRYEAIARHLESLPPKVRAYFVPFRYQEQGVRVGGRDYPLLVMGWAKGEPLGKWVETHYPDSRALRRLCQTLAQLAHDLEAADLSHGDFQHDNLLISRSGRRVHLVDYDGVWVPLLSGQPPGERGHPNYQHPARQSADFGSHGDRFSVLVLQTALYALSCDPTLWDTFREKGDDALLFSRDDFTHPETSPVFGVLRLVAHSDPTLGSLLSALQHACETTEPAALFSSEMFGAEEAHAEHEEENTAPPLAANTETTAKTTDAALSASDGHKWWVQNQKTSTKHRANANKIHRATMWAATLLLIALCYDRVQNEVPAAVMVFIAVYLQSMMLAIGYFAWPDNFGNHNKHSELKTAQNRLNELSHEIYQVERRLSALNAIPANLSVVAFVGQRLNNVLLTAIAAEVGLSLREVSILSRAGVGYLSDAAHATHLPSTISAASQVKLQVARQKATQEARDEFDVLCKFRRDLQHELDRLRSEHAGLDAIVVELKKKANGANGVTFSRFLGHLLGV